MTEGSINVDAIFSNGTEGFVDPPQPDKFDIVVIRCRVAKDDAEEVNAIIDGVPRQMRRERTDDWFDWYSVRIALADKMVSYHFQIKKGSQTLYWCRKGVVDTVDPYFNYVIIPGNSTPDWAKGAVMYQIFVDRFFNGDKGNDVLDREYTYIDEHVTRVRDWNKMPATMGVREFYGGDLQGVWDKLDYLQDLGVEVLYLNPIFVSPSNHKYDTQDYDYIDPHYGVIIEDGGEVLEEHDKENAHATKYIQRVVNKKNLEASNEFFVRFVEEVHRRGMKIILDGVFNHCGSFNKWLDREKIYDKDPSYEKGAFLREDSPYHDFFHFYPEGSWPDNTCYDSWWGNDTLPKLNYEDSAELENYILRIAKKWVSPPYNVDGWRLDVAADLGRSADYNHSFWRKFREVVKRANPNAIVLAEHYGDPSAWLDGTQWDTVMNYDAFMEPISWFLTGMEKHSDAYKEDMIGNAGAFFGSMTDFRTRFTVPALQVAMNELSNHDHSRFLTRTNHMVGRTAFMGPMAAGMGINTAIMRQAVLFQMTWEGAPTIYYGDEAGVCGWTDPDNRRTYPWGHEDKDLIRFHKEMIRIRKDYPVFRTGCTIYMIAEHNAIGFGRFNEDEKTFTILYTGQEGRDFDVDVWRLGMRNGERMVQLMSTGQNGFAPEAKMCYVENGKIRVHLEPNGAVVWKNLNQII